MNTETEIKNLLKDIVELFQEKKKLKRISERVQRGRAASIAAEFEERFAVLLEKVLPNKYFIFVDYPISYEIAGKKRRKTSYPDVAIVRDGSVLVGIIELKIDLGYLRPDWVRKSKYGFEQLRKAKRVKYNTNIGIAKAKAEELSVAANLHRATIVLTGQNDHGRLPFFLKQENCFVLSCNAHPHPNDPAINSSNQTEFLQNIFSCQENQRNWKAFADFLHANFR